VRPRLESGSIGDAVKWSGRNAPRAPLKGAGTMLLPNYDEYVIAYKDRNPAIDAARAANMIARSNSAFANHVAIDGELAGSWSRTIRANAVLIEVSPYKKLTPLQIRAVASAVECYGEYLGLTASLAMV
jgi:hypothetical protein